MNYVPVAQADAQARAKKSGIPLKYAKMRKDGVRVSKFIALHGEVWLRRRRNGRLEYTLLEFRKSGGRWVCTDQSSWRPVGKGGGR